MKDQKKKGIVISYFNIALSMCVNMVLVPTLITSLADDEYSVYKVMQSFTGPLIMFNLGISTIAARCIARFNAAGDSANAKEKENTLGLALLISLAMALLVATIGVAMYVLVPTVFGNTYSAEQLATAQKLLLIFVAVTALHIMADVYKGCIQGNERFVVLHGGSTMQTALRIVFIFGLIYFGKCSAITVALVDLVVYGVLFVFYLGYTIFSLHEKFRLYKIEKEELAAIASFSAAIMLQAIVNQVNNNVDNIILGAMVIDKSVITMYSSALSIYGIYNSLSSVLTGIYFPKATKLVTKDCSETQLTDFVIAPGRFQAMLTIGIIGAFALFGKNFISLWIGAKYINAYYVTLMLIIPVTIPLVQNVCISILDAKLKRLFRSVVLVSMAVINVAVSVVLVHIFGFWGAAIGTAASLIIGHVVVMNIYYSRVIKLQVVRMFKEIFKGVLPAGVLATACCLPLALYLPNSLPMFIVKCACFVAVYGALLWMLGINKSEKDMVKSMLKIKK